MCLIDSKQDKLINNEDETVLIYGENDNDETQSSDLAKKKREQLKQTKISKQAWSIHDIYDRLNKESLDLNPEYQRNNVWGNDKKTSFIESILMGIVVPPIYVVEIEPKNPLETIHYEVVDGKQRITTIFEFLKSKYKLKSSALEYYSDLYGGKNFNEIYNENPDEMTAFLSQVLDVYVITANSPEFSKYDIFSRLNRGAEPLYIDELRRSIWNSELTKIIEENIQIYKNNSSEINYDNIFTKQMQKRYKDNGIFYAGIASYYNTDLDKCIINGYNSRPRDMINKTLENYANNKGHNNIDINKIKNIMDQTLYIYKTYIKKDKKDTDEKFPSAFLYSAIKLAVDYPDEFKENERLILSNKDQLSNKKSPSSTNNVNYVIKLLKELIIGD